MQHTNVLQLKPNWKPSLEDKIERLRDLEREIKKLTEPHTKLKKEICEEMGNSTEAYNSLGHIIATYKEITRKGYEVKECTYRQFKLEK